MKEWEPGRPRPRSWKMKDGNLILISKMEDSHLINTIRFIERNAKAYHEKMTDFYLTCIQPSGDMAVDMFEREVSFWTEGDYTDILPPVYYSLTAEAKKRKLKL